MNTQTDNSESQARAQLESIVAMVKRLEHAEECEGLYCMAIKDVETAKIYGAANYHDADAAREAIQEDALSVEVRSGWVSPGSYLDAPSCWAEYTILLCTGGPAVRIIGELDEHGEPETARLEHQDWGTGWTEYHIPVYEQMYNIEKPQALLTYARQFYYGS